jgi:hypothetical protein
MTTMTTMTTIIYTRIYTTDYNLHLIKSKSRTSPHDERQREGEHRSAGGPSNLDDGRLSLRHHHGLSRGLGGRGGGHGRQGRQRDGANGCLLQGGTRYEVREGTAAERARANQQRSPIGRHTSRPHRSKHHTHRGRPSAETPHRASKRNGSRTEICPHGGRVNPDPADLHLLPMNGSRGLLRGASAPSRRL